MYRTGSFASPIATAALGGAQPNSVPLSPSAYEIGPTADAPARPVIPAEAAQAEQFATMLQVELVHLQGMLKSLTPRWAGSGAEDHRRPAAQTQLAARLQEVDRLLRALRNRFPNSPRV